jgi:hypothetical protein
LYEAKGKEIINGNESEGVISLENTFNAVGQGIDDLEASNSTNDKVRMYYPAGVRIHRGLLND